MIQPRNDYVLVERLEEPQKGTIIIPDVAKERSLRGKVLAIGPGKWIEGINGGLVRRTPEVNVGDLVLFNSKWSDLSSTHYAEDGPAHFDQKLHLIQEGDIFARENAR